MRWFEAFYKDNILTKFKIMVVFFLLPVGSLLARKTDYYPTYYTKSNEVFLAISWIVFHCTCHRTIWPVNSFGYGPVLYYGLVPSFSAQYMQYAAQYHPSCW